MQLWSEHFGSTEVSIERSNITSQAVDAITNAANEELQLGGGVAGAIREAGGKAIQRECDAYVKEHGRVRTGEVALTGAGKLPCKKVIHAVGPMWSESDRRNEEKLIRTVFSVLECAEREQFQSVAIPAISSGLFGCPKKVCAVIFRHSITKYLQDHPQTCLKLIKLVNNDKETATIFLRTFSSDPPAKQEEPQVQPDAETPKKQADLVVPKTYIGPAAAKGPARTAESQAKTSRQGTMTRQQCPCAIL